MRFYGNDELVEGRMKAPEVHYFKMNYEWIKPVVKVSRSGRVLQTFPDYYAAARAAKVEAWVMRAWVKKSMYKKSGVWVFLDALCSDKIQR